MNILMVVVDALRRDHVGCYSCDYGNSNGDGNGDSQAGTGSRSEAGSKPEPKPKPKPKPSPEPEPGLTPFLDELAQGALVFENAYAPANTTVPVLSSLLRGIPFHFYSVLLPDASGRFRWEAPADLREAAAQPSLPEALYARGYTTILVDEGQVMGPTFGRLFSRVILKPFGATANQPAEGMTEAALGILRQAPDAPWFLLVHLWGTHNPYNSRDVQPLNNFTIPQGDRCEEFEARYRAAVHAADRCLARLYEAAQALTLTQAQTLTQWQGRSQDRSHAPSGLLFMVLSDHGELLNQPGGFNHVGVSEAVIRVPLIVSHPGLQPKRVEGLVQHFHLLKWILGLVDRGLPASQMRSLAIEQACACACACASAAYAVSTVPVEDQYQQAAIIKDGYKLVYERDREPHFRLYQLPDEQAMVTDEARQTQLTAALWAGVPAIRERFPEVEVSEIASVEVEERLRALGYIE